MKDYKINDCLMMLCMIRVSGFIGLLFLVSGSCRKAVQPMLIEPVKQEQKQDASPESDSPGPNPVPPSPNPDPPPSPSDPPPPDPPPPPPPPPPPKSLFKIGGQLGARGGVCEKGDCRGVALDVKGSRSTAEKIILEGIGLQGGALVISRGLSSSLSGFWYRWIKDRKAIIGIPLLLDYPAEQPIKDLTFKVTVTGVTPAMQIGTYKGPNRARKEVQDLNGFTRGAISKKPGTAVDGTYYLMLQMSLEEVKGMYDKVKGGTEIRFTITGTAEGYSEDIETITVRLE